jgi:hypothetical protein
LNLLINDVLALLCELPPLHARPLLHIESGTPAVLIERSHMGTTGSRRNDGALARLDVALDNLPLVVSVRSSRGEFGGSAGNSRATASVTTCESAFGCNTRWASPNALAFPGKEHGPELADDHIELAIRERQSHRIRLTPLHRSGCSNRMVMIEHRLIQVRRHDSASVGQ